MKRRKKKKSEQIKADTSLAFENKDFQEMVRLNEPLIIRHARRYSKRAEYKGLNWDDLFSFGQEGLLYAAKNWKPGKGTFSTYANICIDHMIWNRVKATTLELMRHQSQIPAEESELGEIFGEARGYESCPLKALETRQKLQEVWDKVLAPDDNQKRVKSILMALNGYPYSEIATEVGVSKMAISFYLQQFRTKLAGSGICAA